MLSNSLGVERSSTNAGSLCRSGAALPTGGSHDLGRGSLYSRCKETPGQLWNAETKSEAEIISRSTYEQRFLDLKNRISNKEVCHQ